MRGKGVFYDQYGDEIDACADYVQVDLASWCDVSKSNQNCA